MFPGTFGDREDAGLTKLELFTALAMAGLLAEGGVLVSMAKLTEGDLDKTHAGLAKMAFNQARAQLDVLVKNTTP